MPCRPSKSNACLGKPRDLVTVDGVLRTQQRQQLSGLLCLLAATLHLLAPLCPACPALNRMAKADARDRPAPAPASLEVSLGCGASLSVADEAGAVLAAHWLRALNSLSPGTLIHNWPDFPVAAPAASALIRAPLSPAPLLSHA